jgi:hypothetical protein
MLLLRMAIDIYKCKSHVDQFLNCVKAMEKDTGICFECVDCKCRY